ncbi:MAG TPA: NHL repeat-containing protein [Pyrinomonadaceae bacterium]|nr:NHL repeat-containing protein [Pyrinomonadaceae bacterium]
MLALIYLGLAIVLGDLLCRRFYRFASVPHRCAGALLVGILLSTWFTYLAALALAHTAEPLLWAGLLFFVAAAAAIFWLSRNSPKVEMIESRAAGRAIYDWITLGALFIATCALLVGTLYVNKQGRIRVSGMEATHFALQSAIAQGFALGHNFPPECPYYAGQPYHHDFLFYFQVGNLEVLGLNLAWSVDVLSVLGLTSMLALVMALGELLFNSRVVGRIGATLFFFQGSLSFIPFLTPQGSIGGALRAIVHLTNLFPFGYPYRDEAWTHIVFVNQRHLPSGIGVFLLVLIFLVEQYRQRRPETQSSGNQLTNVHAGRQGKPMSAFVPRLVTTATNVFECSTSFIFSGVLLGGLALWSTPVFIAAAAVLLLLLILFPCRLQVMLLGITAAALALPQLLFLGSGAIGPRPQPLLHWGGVDNPTITNAISYIGLTFGAKWPVIVLALILVSWFQRRFFLALCSLFILTFCMQFGTVTLATHTFLNTWLVMANLFVAYGLWWLFKLKVVPILGPLAATTLAAFNVTGGIIDFFPIRNSSYVELNYERDDLVRWLRKNTTPSDIFLTDRFLSHPVLLAGRRIFLGPHNSPAGYGPAKREPIYRQMFESKNPRRVFELLKQNQIDYVVFDDGVRNGELIKDPNEYLYVRYFAKVYDDKENRYHKLVIYKVPESIPANVASIDLSEPSVTAFKGGHGSGRGQFDNPHGLAVDTAGNIFVADTNNWRIEKFSPNGTYITSIGTKGTGYGQLAEPNGIAIDRAGNIYVAEVSNHSVRKLAPDGMSIADWKGPDSGFYGPRRIAIGPDDSIYVVDQGRTRIVKLSPDGRVLATWGSSGSGDGQFSDHTSVAVDPNTNTVYVADPINRRIQVFDSDGKFLTKWLVPEWGRPQGFEDLAIDPDKGRLYASSVNMNTILVFDLQGNRIGTLAPPPPDKLEGPSALALSKDKLFVLNTASERLSLIVLQNR